MLLNLPFHQEASYEDRYPPTEAWVGSEGKSSGTAVLAKDAK
jgi:hypothetical protein